MNISTDCYKTTVSDVFAVHLHVLLADFLLFVSRPTDTLHRTMIWAKRRQRLQTVHQKFGKSVLQFLTSTVKQQSLFAHTLCTFHKAVTYILKLFLSVPFLCSKIIININTRKIFYNAHIKPHIHYVSAVWDDCSEEHFKKIFNSTSKGRQMNPTWSFPIYRAKHQCISNVKPTATVHVQQRTIDV